MIEIIDNNFPKNISRFRALIDSHIDDLQKDEIEKRKKNIEICHVGKFLMNLDNDSYIEKVCEVPDFLISYKENTIGLEHQVIIDRNDKSYEGFFENIFEHVEIELKKDSSVPNLLANCWLYPNIKYRINQKKSFIKLIVELIKEYIRSGFLEDNPIIEQINIMPHSGISVCPNLGAWWQKYLTNNKLQEAIDNKEKRLFDYRKNVDKVWLLIVIGGTNASSYQINLNEQYNITSTFDKIFVLEDYLNKLYQVK